VIKKSKQFDEILRKKLRDVSCVNEIRVEGMMIAIEIFQNGKLVDFKEIWNLMKKVKENGLLTYPFSSKYSSGLSMMPPYIIEENEMLEIADTLLKCLREYQEK